MVSCVVKCCKSNTNSTNKSEGITFHLFPTDNARKNKWVALIRKSRKQPQWQPNKSSVVCSNHFHKYDLYMTQRGLRRVKKSGYPKKNLPELDDQDIVDTISPSTSGREQDSPEFNPVIVDKKEEIKETHLFTPKTTLLPCSFAAPALEFNPVIVIKKEKEENELHLFTPDTTLPCSAAPALDTPELLHPAGDDTILPCSFAAPTFTLPELPDPLALTTVLPSTPAVSTPVPPTLPKMTDKQASIYETPREYKLRLKIERQKNIIQKKTKKIKILQQRVRRLQKRNKSLKGLLGNLDTYLE